MNKKNYFCEVTTYRQKKILFDIYQNIFQDNWCQKSFIDYINNSWVNSFLLFNELKSPIGVCMLSNILNELEIIKFGIKNQYRNQGFGFFFSQ